MTDLDSFAFVLAIVALCLAVFMLGLVTGIRLSGRRYRHAITMIDASGFGRARAGEHNGPSRSHRR